MNVSLQKEADKQCPIYRISTRGNFLTCSYTFLVLLLLDICDIHFGLKLSEK